MSARQKTGTQRKTHTGVRTQTRRYKQQRFENHMALISVFLVVICLAIAFGVKGRELKAKNLEYQIKQDSLDESLADESRRSDELSEKETYVKTKEYVEKVAKEKLGLVNRNEILIKPNQ